VGRAGTGIIGPCRLYAKNNIFRTNSEQGTFWRARFTQLPLGKITALPGLYNLVSREGQAKGWSDKKERTGKGGRQTAGYVPSCNVHLRVPLFSLRLISMSITTNVVMISFVFFSWCMN